MRTSNSVRFIPTTWNRAACALTAGAAVFLITFGLFAQGADDPPLKVMKTGLGSGTVTSDDTPRGIDCGADCDQNYAGAVTVTLTATPTTPGSAFAGWEGDCPGLIPPPSPNQCVLAMSEARSVRAIFRPDPVINQLSEAELTPEGIRNYLSNPDNSAVNTPAEFIAALPRDYRQNWLLMSRSESLQTGTAESPRILLPGATARNVFTVGMTEHSSYPGSHRNAIEYMQWDAAQKNFRFHEIILDTIPEVRFTAATDPPGAPPRVLFPERTRSVTIDDAKCSKCHSTRNVVNLDRAAAPTPTPGPFPGTDGIPAGTVRAKNKPNWDVYDSWGGLMPFNRDRIYQGSVEAAAFRKFFNPWTWRGNANVRAIIEQLELQPPGVPGRDAIGRVSGGANDGHVNFFFDDMPPVLTEPAPAPSPGGTPTPVNYSFDGVAGAGAGSGVMQGGRFVTLHHSATPGEEEGRAVQFFDLLGGADGDLNQQRIGDELASHRFATGGVPLDARPIALAITKGCLTRDAVADNVTPRLAGGVGFFTSRHGGMTLNQVFDNTRLRAQSIPRRKADLQKFNLDRADDNYLDATAAGQLGLLGQYGATTTGGVTANVERFRQEVFQRPLIDETGSFLGDSVIGGLYIDREHYDVGLAPRSNTERVALYRYFLEPLGVSVDKWSMGVRGRSRTYTFADIFAPSPLGRYIPTLTAELEASLDDDGFPGLMGPYTCANLIPAVERSFTALPEATGDPAIPRYTDVQRVFNKSCIECHGGLGYPPFNRFFDATFLDLSENEDPALGNRLDRPNRYAMDFTTTDPDTSRLVIRMRRDSEGCSPTDFTGMMPCGGPKLSQADIETVVRWIRGARPYTVGDPHLKTVDGTSYDFQSAGEFVLLRGENLEVQARQTAVETETPLGPDEHTGLSSCVSINTAVAFRVGPHRITYGPNPSGAPDPGGLQLRVDGALAERLGERGMVLASGGRIMPTAAPGGIRIQYPGGADIVVTPGLWEYYQLWHLNIDVRHTRATEGVMGAIAPGNWLPALPDGSFMGARPDEESQRYQDLYVKFADAWRVSDRTSLFDYAPGSSTGAFTVRAWPGESPRTCRLPKGSENANAKPPQRPLPPEAAQQLCRELVDDELRANCEQDVMVTGEAGFAKTYLLTEQIRLNPLPAAPALLSPEDDKTELATPISFTWRETADPKGDPLTYMHCVWLAGELHTFKQCSDMPKQWGALGGRNLYLLLALLLLLLLILIVLYVRAKRGRAVLALLAAVVLIAFGLALFYGRTGRGGGAMSKTVAGLQPGKAYYWKVIAEDGKGGSVHSETRRFTAK